MAEKVRLIMEADNSKHIKAIKEVQQAHDSLNKTVVKNSKREKGLIEDIEGALNELEEGKKKAYSVKEIEKYNQKIATAKRELKEYNEAGVKVVKTQESMMQKMTKWVLGLGAAAVAMKAVKEVIMATTVGINAFNIAGAATKQVLLNLVTGTGRWHDGLKNVIAAQKELNNLRLGDLIYKRAAIKEQNEYNKSLIDAHDQTKTQIERIKAYDEAIVHLDNSINLQKKSVEKQLKATKEMIDQEKAPSEELLMRYANLTIQLDELDRKRSSGLKEVMSMRSGLIKSETDKQIKAEEDAVKELKRIDDEDTKERLAGMKVYMKAEKDYNELKNKYREVLAKEDYGYVGIWDTIIAKTQKSQETIGEILEESDKKQVAWAKEEAKAKIEALEKELAAQEAVAEKKEFLIDSVQEISAQSIELIATLQNNSYQKELDHLNSMTELKLKMAKSDEQRALILQQAEEKKLELEEKYAKRRKVLALAQATIDTAAAVVKALVSIPPNVPLSIAVGIIGALQMATIAATKFAEGGWTGKGGQRDETGERVAGIVHEEEFVTRRGPAAKYRDVLEAINKDDRRALALSMGNIPEVVAASPSIFVNSMVDNSGSNSRLDKLIDENRRLNKQIANTTSIQDMGNKKIIKRGNRVKIINS